LNIPFKPVEVIVTCSKKDISRPLYLKIALNNENLKIINVDKVLTKGNERIKNNNGISYRCHSLIEGRLFFFELKFELSSSSWKLWRMQNSAEIN
jgi:hypothetical protein